MVATPSSPVQSPLPSKSKSKSTSASTKRVPPKRFPFVRRLQRLRNRTRGQRAIVSLWRAAAVQPRATVDPRRRASRIRVVHFGRAAALPGWVHRLALRTCPQRFVVLVVQRREGDELDDPGCSDRLSVLPRTAGFAGKVLSMSPTDEAAARSTLHALVEALPESDIATARRLLEALAGTAHNDVLSLQDEAAIRAGLESLARGEGIPGADVLERWRRIAP